MITIIINIIITCSCSASLALSAAIIARNLLTTSTTLKQIIIAWLSKYEVKINIMMYHYENKYA